MSMTYDEFKKSTVGRPEQRLAYRSQSYVWNRRSLGAVCGLAGGVIAALLGSLLTASAWFTSGGGGGNSSVHTLGAILLFLTIPLLVLGAHCLDLMDKRKDSLRESRFNEKR